MGDKLIYNGIIGTTVLRGLLALAVALHHADIFGLGYFPLMSGRSAVIGFFVLSAFLAAPTSRVVFGLLTGLLICLLSLRCFGELTLESESSDLA